MTTFTTPGGNPASLIREAILKADKGVCSAGFNTTVQPILIILLNKYNKILN